MASDPRTMLLLTLAIAIVASGFLALECRALRERSLAYWSAGFAVITIGCAISPLREAWSFLIGVWIANGLLLVAHLFFLFGAADFAGRKLTWLWGAPLLAWVLALATGHLHRTETLGVLQSALIGLIALRTASLVLAARDSDTTSKRLGFVFLAHGVWYWIKTILIFVPGAYVDVAVYKGFAIQFSFFEGIIVEVLLALLMAASIRRRREKHVEDLADRDPLTDVLNRRAFERRATGLLRTAADQGRPSALLILDLDDFKAINDRFGHGFGDKVLMTLTRVAQVVLPRDALLARLGGDEFAVLVSGVEATEVATRGDALRSSFADAGAGLGGPSFAITMSVGAVTFEGAPSFEHLLHAADEALYRAKGAGRNRCCTQSLAPRPPTTASPRAAPLLRQACM